MGALFAADTSLAARRSELKKLLADDWEYQLRTFPELAHANRRQKIQRPVQRLFAGGASRHIEHRRSCLRVSSDRHNGISGTGAIEQGAGWSCRAGQTLSLPYSKSGKCRRTSFTVRITPMFRWRRIAPFDSTKDYENYIARLHKVPHALDQAMANMRQGMRDKLMPPKYLLEKLRLQAQSIADAPVEKSPFAKPVAEFPAEVSSAEQKRLRDEVMAAGKRRGAAGLCEVCQVREDGICTAGSD